MTELQSRTKSQPHRFRVSVPVADEAVAQWMGLQDNASLSIRLLIRESIERIGYVDVMNRPVDQLPKRGRPRTPEEESEDAAAAALLPSHQATQASQPVPAALHQVSAGAGELDLSHPDDSRSELLGIALATPALVQGSTPDQDPDDHSSPAVPEPEHSSGGQVQEVNDIFAGLR